MRGKKLLKQLYPSYLLLILISLLAFIGYSSTAFRSFYLEEMAHTLETRTLLIREQILPYLTPIDASRLEYLSNTLGKQTSTRITIILPSGQVLGDSEKNPQLMENLLNRSEVAGALAGQVQRAIRYSPTLQKKMMYVALPIEQQGQILGVVRTALPLVAIENALDGIQLKVIFGGGIIMGLAAILSWLISRRISRPLEEIKQGAERFAQGELEEQLSIHGSEEIEGVANTLNYMAAQLNDRICTISQQRNEQEAILSGMVESVLAVDPQTRLINLNQAAAQLFEIDPQKIKNQKLTELIRNADLQRFIANVLASQKPLETEIILYNQEMQFLQANGTMLRDLQGQRIGAVVVLNDVTRIRRLEQVRKDFVANVSHELRTPITSIQGAVETLIDGASNHPKDAAKFQNIIARHANRLNYIIEDLLTLSKIEQDEDNAEVHLETLSIQAILQGALQMCETKAQQKNIAFDFDWGKEVPVWVNPPLLEQAIVNLIDNAIKYSECNTTIEIRVATTKTEATIHIKDQGCGIAKEHISRLFERFYRVDLARSRKLGGTGLGLAIVKHIVQAHGGFVEVTSSVGEGSTFSIHLKKAV